MRSKLANILSMKTNMESWIVLVVLFKAIDYPLISPLSFLFSENSGGECMSRAKWQALLANAAKFPYNKKKDCEPQNIIRLNLVTFNGTSCSWIKQSKCQLKKDNLAVISPTCIVSWHNMKRFRTEGRRLHLAMSSLWVGWWEGKKAASFGLRHCQNLRARSFNKFQSKLPTLCW